MYLVRRTYKTKPGEARRVATLVHEQVQIYHDAGHREEFRVAYNGGTCPGEGNIVVLEWTTEAFQSPSREGNKHPARRDGSRRCLPPIHREQLHRVLGTADPRQDAGLETRAVLCEFLSPLYLRAR